jgi:hypothetical protein
LVKHQLKGKLNLHFGYFEKYECQNDDFEEKREKVKMPKRLQEADFDL